jgi:hypothetical protein
MSLSGDLTEFGLTELLQVLSMSKKSGVLVLRGDVAHGTLTLLNGRLVDAEVESGPVGEAAFFTLLEVRQGRFVFRGEVDEEGRRSISRTLDSLLLDASGRYGS